MDWYLLVEFIGLLLDFLKWPTTILAGALGIRIVMGKGASEFLLSWRAVSGSRLDVGVRASPPPETRGHEPQGKPVEVDDTADVPAYLTRHRKGQE